MLSGDRVRAQNQRPMQDSPRRERCFKDVALRSSGTAVRTWTGLRGVASAAGDMSGDSERERVARLAPADVEEIADSVVQRVSELLRPQLWFGLVDSAEVARRLGVHENWVYAHADELGVIRLGDGDRARLRFDLERVARAIGATEPERDGRGPGRPRRHGLPTGVRLIEGRGG
jgi:hypothetical protein